MNLPVSSGFFGYLIVLTNYLIFWFKRNENKAEISGLSPKVASCIVIQPIYAHAVLLIILIVCSITYISYLYGVPVLICILISYTLTILIFNSENIVVDFLSPHVL